MLFYNCKQLYTSDVFYIPKVVQCIFQEGWSWWHNLSIIAYIKVTRGGSVQNVWGCIGEVYYLTEANQTPGGNASRSVIPKHSENLIHFCRPVLEHYELPSQMGRMFVRSMGVVRKKGVLAHMTIVVIESSPTPNFAVIKITPFLQMSIYLPFPIPIPPIDATRHTFQNFQQVSQFLKLQRQSQLFSKSTIQSKGSPLETSYYIAT